MSRKQTTQDMAAKQLYSGAEIGKLLGVCTRRVGQWKVKGLIPAKIDRIGLVRYDYDDVVAALAKAKTNPTAKVPTY